MEKKSLIYAYPSSPNAKKHNKGIGCWILKIGKYRDVFQESEKFTALRMFKEYPAEIASGSFTGSEDTFKAEYN